MCGKIIIDKNCTKTNFRISTHRQTFATTMQFSLKQTKIRQFFNNVKRENSCKNNCWGCSITLIWLLFDCSFTWLPFIEGVNVSGEPDAGAQQAQPGGAPGVHNYCLENRRLWIGHSGTICQSSVGSVCSEHYYLGPILPQRSHFYEQDQYSQTDDVRENSQCSSSMCGCPNSRGSGRLWPFPAWEKSRQYHFPFFTMFS